MTDLIQKLPEISSNIPGISIRILNSGWVPWNRGMVMESESNEPIRVPALFVLIEHPAHGYILFDTGYHTFFYKATKIFPFSILRWVTPAEIKDEGNAINQLSGLGLKAADIKTIIISHGHAVHVSGINDFPDSRIIIDDREWKSMNQPAIMALRNAYIKPLYKNITNQIKTINFKEQGLPYGPFKKTLDLWGDNTMILVPLEGHSIGQIGLLINFPDGKRFFFVSDAAHIQENIDQKVPVGRHVQLIQSSNVNYRETLHFLNQLKNNFPVITFIPSHCPETWKYLLSIGLAVR